MVDSETERFINLVRERKAIYDATQQDHQNPLAIDKLWEGIATDAKLPGTINQRLTINNYLQLNCCMN